MFSYLTDVYNRSDTVIQRKIRTFFGSLVIFLGGTLIYFFQQIFSGHAYTNDFLFICLTILLIAGAFVLLATGRYYFSTTVILFAILIPTTLIVWRGETLNELKLYNMALLHSVGIVFAVLVAGRSVQIFLYGFSSLVILGAFLLFRLLPAAHVELYHYYSTFSVVFAITLIETLTGILMFRLLNESLREIKFAAEYDEMTGLPNEYRLGLDLLSQNPPEGDRGQLLFFKVENYTELLLNTGSGITLKALMESAGLVGKYHKGPVYRVNVDVFCIYTERKGEAPEKLMKEILREFKSTVVVDNMNIRILVRGSILKDIGDIHNVRRDISRGLLALYQAKVEKKNYVPFEEEREKIWKQRLNILHELSEAISSRNFSVVYQPIYRADGSVASIESLSRWTDSHGEIVSPAVFIPMLEQSGLTNDFFIIMVAKVLQDMERYGCFKGDFPVYINLSPDLINHNFDFVLLIKMIEESSVPRERIGFEITESGVMENSVTTESVIELLRSSGHSLALDDFGTGYSNLTRILNLPFSKIKFDRSFLTGMKKDRKYGDLLRLLVGHLNDSGFITLIEGIETEEEYNLMKEFGCHEFQGYYLGRPVPPGDLKP